MGAADGLGESNVATGILYDRVLPLSRIADCDGSPASPPVTPARWKQMVFEMSHASLEPPEWPSLSAVEGQTDRSIHRGVIPLVAMSFDYNRIKPGAFEDGALVIQEGRLVERKGDPYTTETAHAVSVLKDYTHRGGNVTFVFDRRWYLTNLAASPVSIEIDFGDGGGYRSVSFGKPLTVSYASPGSKTARTRTTLSDGRVLYGSFVFRVEHLQTPTPDDTLAVTATVPYNAAYGTGEAYVYLSDAHASITNPVIVIEGFDLDNTMNWDELYYLLNGQNLLETMRATGFDAVVLNFTDATDYVQRNSFVVTELIEQVKPYLDSYRDIALVGASMGGLCARYALAYMETNGIDHRVRTFISFDAPHNGANIPLGIQYWLDFFKDQSADAAFLLSRLDTPAARQLLVYHHTTPPGMTGESDPLRAELNADLAALGDYPTALRKVAVANGSGAQVGQGFAAGAQIIDYEYSSFLVDVIGNVWAVPDGPSQVVFDGLIDPILLPADELTVSVGGTLPYDNAPGGWRSSMAQMDSTEAPYGDIVALYPNHCFIPTVSALALGTTDLFYDIDGDPALLTMTPFDAVYFPLDNQEHVSVTSENATWFLDEIELGVVGVASRPSAAPSITLSAPCPNPATGVSEIRYQLDTAGPIEITVYDVAGRRVASLLKAGHHTAGPGVVHLDGGAMASGIYFIRMQTPSSVLARKLTVVH
ncbi:MAG: T9SS type A sorting domain-containing protein [bacterium]